MISYANGQFIPTADVAIPIDNDTAGSIRGYRIFSTALAANGKATFAKDHCTRIIDGAKILKIPFSLSAEDLYGLLTQTIEKNPECQAPTPTIVKIILTGGKSGARIPQMIGEGQLYITVSPITMPPSTYYKEGVHLATYPYQRDLASTKLTYYIGSLLAEDTVNKINAHFPLFTTLMSPEKCLEGDTFNIFFIKDNIIYTPKADGHILNGITRRAIIRLASPHYKVIETDIPTSDIPSFDEAFLTSSIRKVMPVVKINADIIGSYTPGPITEHLSQLLTSEIGY